VAGARDTAVELLKDAHRQGRTLQGWEVDKAARDYTAAHGYGEHFTHRLGHSIGAEVHGDGVNLDSWETHDTRGIIPGVAFSVEPGVYLPEFGVRSEIDVFMSADGPRVTTLVQRDVVLIGDV
jgi:Xaa-Pro aminopeptidase